VRDSSKNAKTFLSCVGVFEEAYSMSCGSSGSGETPKEQWRRRGLTARPAEREHPGAQINYPLFEHNKFYKKTAIRKKQSSDYFFEIISCLRLSTKDFRSLIWVTVISINGATLAGL